MLESVYIFILMKISSISQEKTKGEGNTTNATFRNISKISMQNQFNFAKTWSHKASMCIFIYFCQMVKVGCEGSSWADFLKMACEHHVEQYHMLRGDGGWDFHERAVQIAQVLVSRSSGAQTCASLLTV